MVFEQLDLRRASLSSQPMAGAFALSILLHFLTFATLELGYQTGLWKTTLLFSKKQALIDARTARLLLEARKRQELKNQEVPLVFVEVDPAQASEEAPKEAKYYSALNSKAANPDIRLDRALPKIEGRQDKVPKTRDVPRSQAEPLQPAPTPPAPPKVVEKKPEPEPPPPPPRAEPEPQAGPGELALARPSEQLDPARRSPPREPAPTPEPKPPRPRTLAAARRQKGLPGEKMHQPGGMRRFALEPSLDVRAMPFGSYDAAIIAAIQKRWYDLLEVRPYLAGYSGKVVLEFRLNSDGRVSDMKVSEQSVNEILALICRRAVEDPAPFAPWPADLRRMAGKDYREVRFTFHYN